MLLRESVIELQAGSVLDSRYQIRRLVGKGATGVVLEADDRVTRELVALKVFKPEIATDERWQEIVGSELRHARLLQHPNVCRFFDAGEADGYRFLSHGVRQRRLACGPSCARPLPRQADGGSGGRCPGGGDGLAAIHAAGIIHRDVKPDNVLRMEDGRLVVTDFGLAVAPGQTTFVSGYSGAVGTPSYMAPEVALGGDATMASDVFSLGVILHEIFFDQRPVWDTTKRGRFLISPLDGSSSRLARSMVRLCADCLEAAGAPPPGQRRGGAHALRARGAGAHRQPPRGGRAPAKGALVLGLVGAAGRRRRFLRRPTVPADTVEAELTGVAAGLAPDARLIVARGRAAALPVSGSRRAYGARHLGKQPPGGGGDRFRHRSGE